MLSKSQMKLGLLVSSALTGVVLAGSAQAQAVPVATEQTGGAIKIEYKNGPLSGLDNATTQTAVTTAVTATGSTLTTQEVTDAAKVQVFIGDLTLGGSETLYSGALLASSGTFAKAVEVTYSGKINPDDFANLTIVGRYGAATNGTNGVVLYDPANPGTVTAAILAQNTLTFTNSGYMRNLSTGAGGDLTLNNFGGLITVNNSGLMGAADISASFGGVKLTNTGEMGAVKVGSTLGAIDITNEKKMGNVSVNGDPAVLNLGGAENDYSGTGGTATAVSTSKLGAVKVANSGTMGNVTAVSPLTIDVTNASTGTTGTITASAGGAINIDSAGKSGAVIAFSDGDWAPDGTTPREATLKQRAGAAVTVKAADSAGIYAASAPQKTIVTTAVQGSLPTEATTFSGGGKVAVTAGKSTGDIIAISAGGASVTIDGAVAGPPLAGTTAPTAKNVFVNANGVETDLLVGDATTAGSNRTITRDGGTASLVVEATGSMLPTSKALVATLGKAEATIKGNIGDLFVVSASDALTATYNNNSGLGVALEDTTTVLPNPNVSNGFSFGAGAILTIDSKSFGLGSDETYAVKVPSPDNSANSTKYTWSQARKASGKTATAEVAANASAVNVLVAGDQGATLANAGTIERALVGSWNADLSFENPVSTTSTTGTQASTIDQESAIFDYKQVGKAATFTNAATGKVGKAGSTAAEVYGRESASLTNAGSIVGDVELRSLGADVKITLTKTTTTPTSGTATTAFFAEQKNTVWGGDVTLANSGQITGAVNVAGKDGTVNNSGRIAGTLTLGMATEGATFTVNDAIVSDNVPAVATPQAAEAFKQTYTVNNSGTLGVAGGSENAIRVTGAVNANLAPEQLARDSVAGLTISALNAAISPAFDAMKVTAKSDIVATLNMNSGTIVLGNIVADTGTSATLNLQGAGEGQLGAAAIYNTYAGDYIQVLGVKKVEKKDAGTFTIYGADYVAAPSVPAGVTPVQVAPTGVANNSASTWAMDLYNGDTAGELLISGGELQLAVAADTVSGAGQFGIRGNVTNNATLVVGTRIEPYRNEFADSLITPGEAVAGLNVVQAGNFKQGQTGTTVVAVNPSFARLYDSDASYFDLTSEVLGPIGAGVELAYFTTYDQSYLYPNVRQQGSSWTVNGNLDLAGTIETVATADGIYVNGDKSTLFTYTGTGSVTATASSNLNSPFVGFSVKHDAAKKTVAVEVARKSYSTVAGDTNAAAAGVALDSAITSVASALTKNAATGNAFPTFASLGLTQDMANIISGMDWRVGAAGATAVLEDLSSGEFYGSLAAVDQNVLFGSAVKGLAAARQARGDVGVSFWMAPAGNFAKTTRSEAGATSIKANSYGVSGGFDFAYGENAAIGIGAAYGEHDIYALSNTEKAKADTITLGAYWTQAFNQLTAEVRVAYGFTNFKADRELATLARTAHGEFKGKQLDASAEVAYNFNLGMVDAQPFAKLALRRWTLDGFQEEGGYSVGLDVTEASKTVFQPEFGVRFSGKVGALRPYLAGSYTVRGDIGSVRTVQYLGGGNSFELQGIDPQGFGTVAAGVSGQVSEKISIFLDGQYSFSGGNEVARIGGGIGIKF